LFRSLRIRNFRLFFVGQLASVAGTFMQATAQAWVVLDLTGSGTALGVVAALQYLPILLFGGYAGVVVDRFDRRRLFVITQIAAAVEASVVAVLALTGALEVWMVGIAALVLGTITSVEQTCKQALIFDLVGADDIENAVSLNMSLQNAGRVIGPAVAGLVISTSGVELCFALNAVSFGFVLAAVSMIDVRGLEPSMSAEPGARLFRDGLRQVRQDRRLTTLLVTSAVLFGLAWEYEIVVPLVARFEFDGGPGTLGLLFSAHALGAVAGGLAAARWGEGVPRSLPRRGAAFGGAMLAAAVAPLLWVEALALGACGLTGILLAAGMAARVQLLAPPAIRGRVLALWTVSTIGVRPVGGPIVGAVGEHLGARVALGLGAAAAFVVAPAWLVVGRQIRSARVADAEA
jgi:MFS family permease